MQGHLRLRGKIWYVVIHTTVPYRSKKNSESEGRRKATTKVQWISTGQTSKREAEKILAQKLTEYQSNGAAQAGRQTMGEYLDQWLTDSCEPRLRANTVKQRRILIHEHIAPEIGYKRLSTVGPQDLVRLYRHLLNKPRKDGKGTLSPRTVAICHTILHSAFKEAVEMGVLTSNPASKAHPPKQERHEIVPMTPEEVQAFLAAAETSRYYALYVLAITAGLRLGELLGLRWVDINLDDGMLSVRHTLLRSGRTVQERLAPTKTRSGSRSLALSEMALNALREHRRRQLAERLVAGPAWTDYDLVFPTSKGTPQTDSHIRNRDYARVLKQAGLQHFRPHDMRHTMATLMLAEGVHPKIVQERLGHSRIDMTMDTYSHVLPNLQREAANRLDAVISGTRTGNRKTGSKKKR